MPSDRFTLAQQVGVRGVQLRPLEDALKGEILTHPVLHSNDTPVTMPAPREEENPRAYLRAYAPGVFEDLKAVV